MFPCPPIRFQHPTLHPLQLAEALLEHETLTAKDIKLVLAGKPVSKKVAKSTAEGGAKSRLAQKKQKKGEEETSRIISPDPVQVLVVEGDS